MAKIESRCGLLCSACGYREQMNCGGCVSIAQPFWGESCPVKSCCEGRGLAHYGECGEFPCGRYEGIDEYDSFITHRRRLADLETHRRRRELMGM